MQRRTSAGAVALIATSVFGEDGKRHDALDKAVRARLTAIYDAHAGRWETLDIRHVEHAVVSMHSPHNFARGNFFCSTSNTRTSWLAR